MTSDYWNGYRLGVAIAMNYGAITLQREVELAASMADNPGRIAFAAGVCDAALSYHQECN